MPKVLRIARDVTLVSEAHSKNLTNEEETRQIHLKERK
jgi:hypothetical protein